ncbi:VPS54 subunit of GARP complex scat isoform X2 [Lycorma delicatula]|uniref:VPS54 subunit of GARP complex scat isoform X2 n=1 Tax=Lycorma delicatula TaxID=130591 RepID=UPI003F516C61
MFWFQFIHLRQKHCTQEGGSFVCRYGDNKVCCTLPVEGVSDADYEQHVYKHHAFSGPNNKARKVSSASMASNHSRAQSSDGSEKWTIFSASQNLPAVLNDPTKGKQKDFFTKMWGDSFVEVTNIPGPSYLPNITLQHFQGYLRKIAKRHRKHSKLNAAIPKPHSHADLLQNFPNLRVGKCIDKFQFDVSSIPKIFLEQNFNLSSIETFSAVYPHTAISSSSPTSLSTANSSSTSSSSPSHNSVNKNSSNNNNYSSSDIVNTSSPNSSAKLLQEKLTHYLDMVEVQIAQQVAQKSEAFFHAMTSHDTLMEQLGQNIAIVKTLREKIRSIDNDLVKDPLLIMRSERTRRNHHVVLEKLKLMSSVLQTQPTIQLLLSTPDYVAALDLIYTTQDLLAQELAGVHSFRHLSSELNEMVKVIDTLMAGEFERYATADLNRPLLESEATVLEGDKLSCIVLGMLRQSSFEFVDAYQQETVAAIKAAVKKTGIEVVASSEFANSKVLNDSVSLEDQLKALSVEEWTLLLKNATTDLLRLVRRVKNAKDVMQRAADVSAGKQQSMVASTDSEITGQPHLSVVSEPGECFLSSEDYSRVTHKLNCLLVSTCQYAQERCAQLLSSRSLVWPEENGKEDDSYGNSKVSAHWLAERATLTQLSELSKHVDLLSIECERICPDAPPSLLRSAFKSQANKFMHRFHLERMTKLSLILESEAWRQTEVPVEFQQLVNHISESGRFSVSKDEVEEMKKQGNCKPANVLYVGSEKFAVVGTVLILVDIVAEYCVRAEDITLTAHSLLRHLAELLQVFNSRTAKLVLGAEAVSDKTGLKKITSINLALVLRALQLILWLIPHVRIHFEGLLPESSRMTALDQVTQQMRSHVRDVQNKLCAILEPLISNELRQWEAKPPVPSRAFQNICSKLRKLYEAVAGVLPEEQIEDLYRSINTTFKDILREHLLRMNIVNNGGPQHGLVTSELIFYIEDLKRIKALPEHELNLNLMDDIWTSRQAVIR